MKLKKVCAVGIVAIIAVVAIGIIIHFTSGAKNTNTQQKHTFEHGISLPKVDESISKLYYSEQEQLENMTLFKPNNSNFCMQIPNDASIYAGEHNDDNINAYTYRIDFGDNRISITDTYKYDKIQKPNSIEELIEYQKQDGITLEGELGDFEILSENGEYAGYSYCQYIGDKYKSYRKVYIDDNRIIGISAKNSDDINVKQCLSSFVLLSHLNQ